MCKQEEQTIVIKSDESSLDESSFRNFTHHAAEVKTSILKINKISSRMTCTSDTLMQDDQMDCLVSDATLSDVNLFNESF